MSNFKSKSEIYLENRSNVPSVSALMSSSVSQYRKEILGMEVEQGLFKEGSGSGAVERNYGMTSNANVV
jgi:hypothetical protein